MIDGLVEQLMGGKLPVDFRAERRYNGLPTLHPFAPYIPLHIYIDILGGLGLAENGPHPQPPH
jgi:hypothetical protein